MLHKQDTDSLIKPFVVNPATRLRSLTRFCQRKRNAPEQVKPLGMRIGGVRISNRRTPILSLLRRSGTAAQLSGEVAPWRRTQLFSRKVDASGRMSHYTPGDLSTRRLDPFSH